MKKNVIKTAVAAVCVVAAGMGGFKAYNVTTQSEADMLLAENVEALSQTDYYSTSEQQAAQYVAEKVISYINRKDYIAILNSKKIENYSAPPTISVTHEDVVGNKHTVEVKPGDKTKETRWVKCYECWRVEDGEGVYAHCWDIKNRC